VFGRKRKGVLWGPGGEKKIWREGEGSLVESDKWSTKGTLQSESGKTRGVRKRRLIKRMGELKKGEVERRKRWG